MIDFYDFQQEKFSRNKTKMVDYRNGRYIGQYLGNNETLNGYGALLDHNFLLVLGQWQENKLKSSSLIIFPDNSYFIGKFTDGLPSQLCLYTTNKLEKVYCLFGSTQIKIIYEQKSKNNLIFLKIKRQELDFFIRLKEHSRLNEDKQYKISQENYKSQEQKMKIIQNYLQKTDKLQINQFLKQFCKSANKNKTIFDLSEDSEKIYIKISDQSPLFILTKKKAQQQFSFIGFSQQTPKKHQFCKMTNQRVISQIIDSRPYIYNLGQTRSIRWFKGIDTFLKKSLNFKNKFIHTDQFYRVKYILESFRNIIISQKDRKALKNPQQMQFRKFSRSNISLNIMQIRDIYKQTLSQSRTNLKPNNSHEKGTYTKRKSLKKLKSTETIFQADVQALQKYYIKLTKSEQNSPEDNVQNDNITKSLFQKDQQLLKATPSTKKLNDIETTAIPRGGLRVIEQKKES